MKADKRNPTDKPGLRQISTHTIRETVIYNIGVRDLPRIRAAMCAVGNLITRHDEFDVDKIRSDFVFTLTEAIAYDLDTWRPWGKAIISQLATMKATGKLETRVDYLEAWGEIIDSIDNVMDVTYNQPLPSEN